MSHEGFVNKQVPEFLECLLIRFDVNALSFSTVVVRLGKMPF